MSMIDFTNPALAVVNTIPRSNWGFGLWRVYAEGGTVSWEDDGIGIASPGELVGHMDEIGALDGPLTVRQQDPFNVDVIILQDFFSPEVGGFLIGPESGWWQWQQADGTWSVRQIITATNADGSYVIHPSLTNITALRFGTTELGTPQQLAADNDFALAYIGETSIAEPSLLLMFALGGAALASRLRRRHD